MFALAILVPLLVSRLISILLFCALAWLLSRGIRSKPIRSMAVISGAAFGLATPGLWSSAHQEAADTACASDGGLRINELANPAGIRFDVWPTDFGRVTKPSQSDIESRLLRFRLPYLEVPAGSTAIPDARVRPPATKSSPKPETEPRVERFFFLSAGSPECLQANEDQSVLSTNTGGATKNSCLARQYDDIGFAPYVFTGETLNKRQWIYMFAWRVYSLRSANDYREIATLKQSQVHDPGGNRADQAVQCAIAVDPADIVPLAFGLSLRKRRDQNGRLAPEPTAEGPVSLGRPTYAQAPLHQYRPSSAAPLKVIRTISSNAGEALSPSVPRNAGSPHELPAGEYSSRKLAVTSPSTLPFHLSDSREGAILTAMVNETAIRTLLNFKLEGATVSRALRHPAGWFLVISGENASVNRSVRVLQLNRNGEVLRVSNHAPRTPFVDGATLGLYVGDLFSDGDDLQLDFIGIFHARDKRSPYSGGYKRERLVLGIPD